MVLMNVVHHYEHPMPLITELDLILPDVCGDDDVDLLHVEDCCCWTTPIVCIGRRETNTLTVTVRWIGNMISTVSSY